jgi:hypothetical protein
MLDVRPVEGLDTADQGLKISNTAKKTSSLILRRRSEG